MPMFEMECVHGHSRDVYAHSSLHRACRTIVCDVCQSTMGPVFSPGTSLTYFSEKGGGRVINNLGPTPVLVTSHGHHEKLMREAGVSWAPGRRGEKGCWGG